MVSMEKEKVLCPCCNAPMEAGFIIDEALQFIIWHTENAGPPYLHMLEAYEGNPNAVILAKDYQKAKDTPWKRPMITVRAYLCRSCKKCLVDYDRGAEAANTDAAAQRWNRY